MNYPKPVMPPGILETGARHEAAPGQRTEFHPGDSPGYRAIFVDIKATRKLLRVFLVSFHYTG